MDRRDFLRLSAAGGGAVFASALPGAAALAAEGPDSDFYFVQLSDLHWGYQGPANLDPKGTLPKAIAAVNALPRKPDFIVFTGDLTHTTDDPAIRRQRLAEFKSMVADLEVKSHRYMPGEHDASLDHGAAFEEAFGPTHYRFVHRGINFVAIDNVSEFGSKIGDEQLVWLKSELADLDRKAPLVVFTHRPLFDLAPQWDWHTRDGAQAIEMLSSFEHVTVFYGHIHQENHHMTGRIAHHSALSLMFPLPAPGSQKERTPLNWDPASPYRGLGYREIESTQGGLGFTLAEHPVVGA